MEARLEQYQAPRWVTRYTRELPSRHTGIILALYFITEDLNQELSATPYRLVLIPSQLTGPAILASLPLSRYDSYQAINYFNPINVPDYTIFVGPDPQGGYYRWEFSRPEIDDFVTTCREFSTDPRQYCYGPAVDKDYHLYHLEGETYYRGYDHWPREENRYLYNPEGEIIATQTAWGRPLYPLTEEEQDHQYIEDRKSLPTWKTATNDQSRYDTTTGRDDYSPYTGDSINSRGGVNHPDIELSEMGYDVDVDSREWDGATVG